jgi:hypothetical protein
MSDAAVRFFCLMLPNGGAGLGYAYLEAFDQTGLGVKACPIGPAYLGADPWPKYAHLIFIGQVARSFVNVVVAPPNLLMGTRLRATDVKPPNHLPTAGEETAPFALSAGTPATPAAAAEEVVYEPQTALGGLYTVGVPNIAITLPRPKPPEDHEVRALAQYDAILCPTDADATALRHLGLVAFNVPPEPGQLARIVSWLLP